jgi:preprotein translocase subunit SecE
MRREQRRHPLQGTQTKRRGSNRPARASAASGPGTGQRSVAAARSPLPAGGLRSLLSPQWFRDVVRELRMVTWPTRQETINLTMVVVVVALVLGLFLGGVDYVFNWVIEHTLLR